MKLKIILSTLMVAITLVGCNSNSTDKSRETVVREDLFIKEYPSTQSVESNTISNGESTTRQDEENLLDMLEQATQPGEITINRSNIWNIEEFTEFELELVNTSEIKNERLLNIIDENFAGIEDTILSAIINVCEKHSIEVSTVRLLGDRVKYSTDYKFAGLQLQSNEYYIDIAYSSRNGSMCYRIQDKK